MTKFQFLLVTSLVTSVIFLIMGSRDSNPFGSIFPVAIMVALAALGNRFITEPIWNKAALWVNNVTGRRIFRVNLKRLPPSKSRRLR